MTHVTQTLLIDVTRARKDVIPNICHMRHRARIKSASGGPMIDVLAMTVAILQPDLSPLPFEILIQEKPLRTMAFSKQNL